MEEIRDEDQIINGIFRLCKSAKTPCFCGKIRCDILKEHNREGTILVYEHYYGGMGYER